MSLLGGLLGGTGGGGGLLGSLTPTAAAALGYKGTPATGTGIKPFIEWARPQGLVIPSTIAAILPELPGLFGGYPYNNHKTERIPDIVMLSLFSALAAAFAYIFIQDTSRRHNFFFTFGVLFFCLFKIIGYALRFRWSYDVTQLNVGIAAVVFIQVAQLALLVMNQILAHRIFTWRHPETGSSWWVAIFFDIIYFLVVGIIVLAILGQALPYLYFMGDHHYHMCRQAMQAGAILNLIYALLPITIVFIAFVFKPGTLTAEPWKRKAIDRVLPPVSQPTWINSAGIFYFPRRGSQKIIYKDQPAAKAIRIMPSREPPAGGLHELHHEPMHPNAPRVYVAVLVILVAALVLSLNTCFRVAACFRPGPTGTNPFFPLHASAQYIFYGATEAAVLAMYLLTRVDLRFYIPDMPRSAKANPHPYNGSDYNDPKPLDDGYATPPATHNAALAAAAPYGSLNQHSQDHGASQVHGAPQARGAAQDPSDTQGYDSARGQGLSQGYATTHNNPPTAGYETRGNRVVEKDYETPYGRVHARGIQTTQGPPEDETTHTRIISEGYEQAHGSIPPQAYEVAVDQFSKGNIPQGHA